MGRIMKRLILITIFLIGGIILNYNPAKANLIQSSQRKTDWVYFKDVKMYLRVEQEYPNGKTNALIYEKRASVYEKYVGEFQYLQVHYYVGKQYIVVEAYQNRRYNQTKDFYGRHQYVTSSGWYFSL